MPYLVVHPVGLSYKTQEEKQNRKQQNVEVIKKLAKFAENTDVKITLENMRIGRTGGPRFGTGISDLLQVIHEVSSPSVGICLDTGHAHAMNIDVAKAIHECGSLLWATHISCNNGKGDGHRLPYNSEYYYYSKWKIDWVQVIHALRAINYQNLFDLEIPGETVQPVFVRDLKLEYTKKLTDWLLNQ